jgi:hypothetical protein
MLNSLPFIDLDEQITFENNSILTSSLFREISATHFIPYHLMLKWGSIYHRYKTHLIDGVDILNGSIDSSYNVRPLSGKTLFDNNSSLSAAIIGGVSSTGTTVTVPSVSNIQTGMKIAVISGTGQTANNTIITGITNPTTIELSQTPLTGLTGATIYVVYDENITFDIIPRVSTTTGSTTGVTYIPYTDVIPSTTGSTTGTTYTGYTNVGVNPYYQAIYSQIVNDYSSYNPLLGNVSYSADTASNLQPVSDMAESVRIWHHYDHVLALIGTGKIDHGGHCSWIAHHIWVAGNLVAVRRTSEESLDVNTGHGSG